MIVMKFGGSSIASAEKVRRCINLVQAELARDPVVVVSAHGKTTNKLIAAAESALAGIADATPIIDDHMAITAELGVDASIIEPLFDDLGSLLHGVSLVRELTPRTRDQIMSFGERLSTRVIAAAMNASGLPAQAVNSYEVGLSTDNQHGQATPLLDIDAAIKTGLSGVDGVPVVTGFLGRGPHGAITTLGRSGSDLSASLFGAALEAEEVQIWTDVSGVMTCEPSLDPRAESLRELSFEEASELAYFGVEVLHPMTLVPAMRKSIPVRVLNTMRPDDEGTLIVNDPIRTNRFAKSIVYKEDVDLVTLSSPRLMSAVQMLSRAFEILAQHGIRVHMAATSEATVSMVTDRDYSDELFESAHRALGELGGLTVEREMAIICVVGEELKDQGDVLGTVFGRLADSRIKAKMVSQSATEINVAFLVENSQIESAVQALHTLIVGAV